MLEKKRKRKKTESGYEDLWIKYVNKWSETDMQQAIEEGGVGLKICCKSMDSAKVNTWRMCKGEKLPVCAGKENSIYWSWRNRPG